MIVCLGLWPLSRLRAYTQGAPDGILYGCWYTQLLEPFARGTGIAVRAGRQLQFLSKAAAKHWSTAESGRAGRNDDGTSASHCGGHWDRVPADLVERTRLGANISAKVLDRIVSFGDNTLGACGREAGYEAMQMSAGSSASNSSPRWRNLPHACLCMCDL